MKKKKYIMPRVLMVSLVVDTNFTAGSWQSDEPGAKSNNSFEEQINPNEDGGDVLPYAG
ncbi:MAG: hypothetical protein HXO19_03880 [Prevotella shahii]|jgi:hypothetical protein|uniref:hypothetical protein n=1 Tax=Hoylesella shahii TaxID=228603 RepID=UPI001CB130D4|nr:hypothetical protein [Hoylesella shahii]MBF1590246.1 hypothetical protein [Hoylesella shahii]